MLIHTRGSVSTSVCTLAAVPRPHTRRINRAQTAAAENIPDGKFLVSCSSREEESAIEKTLHVQVGNCLLAILRLLSAVTVTHVFPTTKLFLRHATVAVRYSARMKPGVDAQGDVHFIAPSKKRLECGQSNVLLESGNGHHRWREVDNFA